MAYVCSTCSKSFTQMTNLTRHVKTTHLGKTFKYQECDRSFTRMDALIHHGQQHQQLVTHRCDKCLKEFYRRDKLVEHRVVCGGNTLKRKSDDPVDTTSKAKPSKVDETAHSSDQIGHGHGDDDPCNLTSAFEGNLKINCVVNPN